METLEDSVLRDVGKDDAAPFRQEVKLSSRVDKVCALADPFSAEAMADGRSRIPIIALEFFSFGSAYQHVTSWLSRVSILDRHCPGHPVLLIDTLFCGGLKHTLHTRYSPGVHSIEPALLHLWGPVG